MNTLLQAALLRPAPTQTCCRECGEVSDCGPLCGDCYSSLADAHREADSELNWALLRLPNITDPNERRETEQEIAQLRSEMQRLEERGR